jgi:uncharacterized protein with NRDE domain
MPWTEEGSTVCLLIMLAQTRPDLPLVVAANRDEFLERPAVAMTVLRASAPRVLGGRDELARGTWLAVNEAGVVAALTNRPTPGGKDPTKRSRGELPLALASHTSADTAVKAFADRYRPSDYNSAWLLVGDREGAFAVDMSGDDGPVVEQLPAGMHVLENRPLGAPSPKAAHVRNLMADAGTLPEAELVRHLQMVLGDHELPAGAAATDEAGTEAPPEVKAACVHTEEYGTRWSGVITVPAGTGPPTVRYSEGHACEARYRDAGSLW